VSPVHAKRGTILFNEATSIVILCKRENYCQATCKGGSFTYNSQFFYALCLKKFSHAAQIFCNPRVSDIF
jgi:hypothetical protein